MATAKEMRALIGKTIKFTSARSRQYIFPEWVGRVGDVTRSETYVADDWHNTKSVKIIEIIEDH